MHYHLIGIGGSSMAGIATVLRAQGHTVSGTDVQTTGHGPNLIPDATDVVIYTDSVTPGSAGSEELAAARVRGIRTIRRIDFLAESMVGKQSVAVAGAHGKSTTTALIGWVLAEAGLDPTVFVGADLPAWGGSARAGYGGFVIAEACEWNRQFLELSPTVLVVTTIDAEHLDTYPGGVPEIQAAFRQAAEQVEPGGFVVGNGDDEPTRSALNGIQRPVRFVGRSSTGDYTIRSSGLAVDGQLAVTIRRPSGADLDIVSPLIGEHHATNLALSVAVLEGLGVSERAIADGLRSFPGLARRFERLRDDRTLTIVDDYAHHPTEIRSTLTAARERYPTRRLVVAFQPHLSERTTEHFEAFVATLSATDRVLVIDTYEPAGRPIQPGAKTSVDLATAVTAAGGSAVASGGLPETAARLQRELQSDDLLLTLGAGRANELDELFRTWQPASGRLEA